MKFHRTVTTRTPPQKVFGYLSDFTTTTEWEPGTVRTELISGAGGVDTKYRNISKFLGRETELTYVVMDYEPDALIRLRGHNKTVEVLDSMTVRPRADGGSEVVYEAGFTFTGAARLATPVLWIALRRLVNSATRDLRETLEKLPA